MLVKNWNPVLRDTPGSFNKEGCFSRGPYLQEQKEKENWGWEHWRPSQFHRMSRQHIRLDLNVRLCTASMSQTMLMIREKRRGLAARRWSRSHHWLRQPHVKEAPQAAPECCARSFPKCSAIFRRFFLISGYTEKLTTLVFLERTSRAIF